MSGRESRTPILVPSLDARIPAAAARIGIHHLNPGFLISYHVIDATDEQQLLSLGDNKFDAALSNMALFDMADIEVLFRTLPMLLKPDGIFVFSLMHPCFNNSSSVHTREESDDGEIKTLYSVKVSRYMTSYHARGLALRNQASPQMYFERPLQYYLNLGFQNGFILDGFEERAFQPTARRPVRWGGEAGSARSRLRW